MDASTNKAFDVAIEIHKQLIALASGIITITITFSKDLFDDKSCIIAVRAAWLIYLLSIMMGVWGLMSLAGSLGRTPPSGSATNTSDPSPRINLYNSNITIPAFAHLVVFIIATSLIVYFGFSMTLKIDGQSIPNPGFMTLKVEPLKVEPLKTETMKVEPLKSEIMKVEPLRSETLKVDHLKSETLRTEPLKSETLKVEPLTIELKLPKKPTPNQQ